MSSSGRFETHLTVALLVDQDWERLQKWAERHGLKCLHIVLSRGNTTSQPMLSRWGEGRFIEQLRKARELSATLESAGFSVTRIKIEAAPSNHDLPDAISDLRHESAGRYFEHHVKLLMTPGEDMGSLLAVAQQHGSHFSRNALRVREDGFQERFLTQRCHSVGRREAHQQLESLLIALTCLKQTILEVEEEYVVFDSNIAIDDGWLETGD